jgi:sensor histidine kinase regulating citrate/malate metabolism
LALFSQFPIFGFHQKQNIIMKKFLSLILSLAFVFSLAACDSKPTTEAQAETETEATVEATAEVADEAEVEAEVEAETEEAKTEETAAE